MRCRVPKINSKMRKEIDGYTKNRVADHLLKNGVIVPPFKEHKNRNEKKTRTNFDRIKAMSVEEMADFLLEVHSDGWVMGANDDLEDPLYNKEWLESEVQE